MSAGRVLLIRHAQASFGSDDYDCLSEHGGLQAARLGAWIAATRERAYAWFASGTMRRHRQTVDAITQACAIAGVPLPDCIYDPDWNEFDHAAVIRAYARTQPHDPQLALARDTRERRAVHAVLAGALQAWARDELTDVPESWAACSARIARARARLAREAPPGAALVVTSGGAIARCAQAALGLDDRRAVELNLGLRNTAVSEFRRDGAEWRLLMWNALPHLAGHDERAWITYY